MQITAQLRSARATFNSALAIALLCGLGAVSVTTVQAKGLKYAAIAAPAPACGAPCVLTHSTTSCPNFLTTPYSEPCVGFKMKHTACGWQMRRTFMCW